MPQPPSGDGWHRALSIVVACLIVLLVLACGYGTFHLVSAAGHARALYRQAVSLRDAAGDDPAALGRALPQVYDTMRDLRTDLDPFVWLAHRADWVPQVGPTARVACLSLDAGLGSLGVAVLAWEAMAEAPPTATEGEDGPLLALSAVLPALGERHEELAERSGEAAAALRALQEVDPAALIGPLRAPLARAQEVLPLAVAAFEALPELPREGARPGEWAYLLLALNNDELRPSGGFVSSVGELLLTDGKPSGLAFRDSYRLDNWSKPHDDPPEPLRRHMEIDLWVLRDANWWPDFPTSARAISDMYERDQERPVAAVVAADVYAATVLLDALAPLELPGGARLEKGRVAEGFRELWSLPEGALRTDGVEAATTRPYAAIEVELCFSEHAGEVWLDDARLEPLDPPGPDAIRNGSLEEDADGDGIPDGWEAHGFAPGDGLVDGVAHDGQRSLYLRGALDAEKRLVQRIALGGEAGERWALSALSRAQGVEAKGGPYAMIVRFLGADGEVEEFAAHFPPFTNDWASAGARDVVLNWWSERKDFVGLAVGAAMERVLSSPATVPWADLLSAARSLLDERHIQVHFADERLQGVVEAHGWAGRLAEPTGDYLLIVDSNVGYNKVSASVRQTLAYRVDLTDPTRPRALLTLTYENTSRPVPLPCDKFRQYEPTYEGMTSGCYWDYVRVYAPDGATLLDGRGGDEPWEANAELGRAVFATYLVLEPGERRELTVEYALPERVARGGRYGLLVQKQAGTVAHPLTVTVVGAGLRTGVGAPDAVTRRPSDGALVWETDLRVDRTLTVSLGSP